MYKSRLLQQIVDAVDQDSSWIELLEFGEVQLPTLLEIRQEVHGVVGMLDEGNVYDAMEVLDVISASIHLAVEELRPVVQWDPAEPPTAPTGLSIVETIDTVRRVTGLVQEGADA